MNKLLIHLLIIFLSFSYSHADIAIFLKPDKSLKPIATLKNDDPVFRAYGPALDPAFQKKGWNWIEYTGLVTGYINPLAVNTDLSISPGTTVYSEPDSPDSAFTHFDEKDTAEITNVTKWVEIRLKKAIPVYFLKPYPDWDPLENSSHSSYIIVGQMGTKPKELTTKNTKAIKENESPSSPTVTSKTALTKKTKLAPKTKIAPKKKTATRGKNKTRSKITQKPKPTAKPKIIAKPESASQVVLAPRTKPKTIKPEINKQKTNTPSQTKPAKVAKVSKASKTTKATRIEEPIKTSAQKESLTEIHPKEASISNQSLNYFYGILKFKKAFFFIKPKYRYVLVNNQGHEMAYIKTNKLVTGKALSHFIDQQVRIQGQSRIISGDVPLIISARIIKRQTVYK